MALISSPSHTAKARPSCMSTEIIFLLLKGNSSKRIYGVFVCFFVVQLRATRISTEQQQKKYFCFWALANCARYFTTSLGCCLQNTFKIWKGKKTRCSMHRHFSSAASCTVSFFGCRFTPVAIVKTLIWTVNNFVPRCFFLVNKYRRRNRCKEQNIDFPTLTGALLFFRFTKILLNVQWWQWDRTHLHTIFV